jgi:hypothetical protein
LDNIDLSGDYLPIDGSEPMTGTLLTPDLKVQNLTENTLSKILIEGKQNGTSNASARLTFSNKQYNNAYGSIEFKGQNASGWFEINKDLDLTSHGLHSVQRIRLRGERTIQDGDSGNAVRINLAGKVTIPRNLASGSGGKGFTLEGQDGSGNDLSDGLLSVHHNNASSLDAVNYYGRTNANTNNIANTKYVDAKVGNYLPLTGGELTGKTTVKVGSNIAFEIKQNSTAQIQIWASGAIAVPNYTAFKANELVTKAYVDGKVGSGGGGGFTPGDQVAKTDGASNNIGGFWITSGALYVKVS